MRPIEQGTVFIQIRRTGCLHIQIGRKRILSRHPAEHFLHRQQPMLASHVIARIVSLIGVHLLPVAFELHQGQIAFPQSRRKTSTTTQHGQPSGTGILLQLHVQGSLFGKLDFFQRSDGLMIFHHLDGTDILLGNTVRSNAVPSFQHIQSLDIEFVDGLPVVRNTSACLYINARHLFQHIGYGLILTISESGYIIDNRIPFCPYLGSLHHDFLYPNHFRFHRYPILLLGNLQGKMNRFIPHQRKGEHPFFHSRCFKNESSLFIGRGMSKNSLSILRFQHNNDIGQRFLASPINHLTGKCHALSRQKHRHPTHYH